MTAVTMVGLSVAILLVVLAVVVLSAPTVHTDLIDPDEDDRHMAAADTETAEAEEHTHTWQHSADGHLFCGCGERTVETYTLIEAAPYLWPHTPED